MSESPSVLRVLHEVVEIDSQLLSLKYTDPDFDKKIKHCRSRLSVANAKIRCLNILKTCVDTITGAPTPNPKPTKAIRRVNNVKYKNKKTRSKSWYCVIA